MLEIDYELYLLTMYWLLSQYQNNKNIFHKYIKGYGNIGTQNKWNENK